MCVICDDQIQIRLSTIVLGYGSILIKTHKMMKYSFSVCYNDREFICDKYRCMNWELICGGNHDCRDGSEEFRCGKTEC